jgi:hypothetical protein
MRPKSGETGKTVHEQGEFHLEEEGGREGGMKEGGREG